MRPLSIIAVLVYSSLLVSCSNKATLVGMAKYTSPEKNQSEFEEVSAQSEKSIITDSENLATSKLQTEASDDPQKLIGLSPKSLSKRLGSPGVIRRDGAAEIWLYQGKNCILHVFLYRSNTALGVKYVELRGPGTVGKSHLACFVEMLRSHSSAGNS